MDAIIRKGIEEAIRFLRPGDSYTCTVDDDHQIEIVARCQPAGYVVACVTCSTLIALDVEHRRVYPPIHRHTKEPLPNG